MAMRMQHGPAGDDHMDFSRRVLLCGAAALGVVPAKAAKVQEEYRFRTAELDIRMTVEFHDGYDSRGFWFREKETDRPFCLSASGESGRNCVENFRGSLAIAYYKVQPRSKRKGTPVLREYVRTIDHDPRLDSRPPFERAIELRHGIGSDLQAFGYEPEPGEALPPDRHGPWRLYRQDLFLEPQTTPFLVVFWKHALTSIRVLDVIPGDQTWILPK